MKDLDFDELDRAVNSLIQASPIDTSSNEEVVERVVDIPSSLPDQDFQFQPQPSEPIIESTPAFQPQAEEKATPSLVGRRSSGQFMDVVHPSSNMRKAPLAIPERPRPATSSFKPITSPDVTPVTPTDEPLAQNNWTSPIEFQDYTTNPSNEVETDDIDKIAESINQELGQTNDNSPDSPFISDAVVQKRPLGAFSDDLTVAVETDSVETLDVEPEPIETESKPAEHNSSLPAELQNDLLNIEDNDATSLVDDNDVELETKSMEVVSVQEPTAEIAPINQQYAEQPTSGDQTSGAIYDTNAYHKALVKPSKKKSGWLWVLWIVLLILLGVGAGAALYMLKVI